MNVHASSDEHGNLKEPKTEAGHCILPMPKNVSEALKARKATMVSTLAKYAPDKLVKHDPEKGEPPAGYVEHEGGWYDIAGDMPVTGATTDKRPKPHSLSVWRPLHRKDSDLDGWSPHELSHSYLSLAAANGVHPSVMQRLAGHKTATTTMEIYTHINMASKSAAMDVTHAAYA